jgi:beta-1,4-N-acetylgalactosaminyltransferase
MPPKFSQVNNHKNLISPYTGKPYGLLHKSYDFFVSCRRRWSVAKRVLCDFRKPTPVNGPVSPYAFIRVRNERPTLRCSLESILPAIKKGVIAYHNCTDESEEIILDFCGKNPDFIPAKYDWFTRYEDSRSARLTRYYNWTLAHLPQNEWLIKIDCDQIYDADILMETFAMPETTDDIVLLPRIQLHYDDRLYVLAKKPFLFANDHWLLYNDDNIYFVNHVPYNLEDLKITNYYKRRHLMAKISNWHFPFMKEDRRKNMPETVLFNEWITTWDGKLWDTTSGKIFSDKLLDMKMLNINHIMKFVEKFD